MAKHRRTTNKLNEAPKKRTSIGKSTRSRPKSKAGKRSWKKYRGQGK